MERRSREKILLDKFTSYLRVCKAKVNRINCISDHLLAPAGKPPMDRTPKDVEIIGAVQAVMKSQIMMNQIEREEPEFEYNKKCSQ